MKTIITIVMLFGFVGFSNDAHAIKKKTAQRMCEGTWEEPCTRSDAPEGTVACCNNGAPVDRMVNQGSNGKFGKVNTSAVTKEKIFYLNGSRPLDAEEIAIINQKLKQNPKLRDQFEVR
jgi:hypothetical protein